MIKSRNILLVLFLSFAFSFAMLSSSAFAGSYSEKVEGGCSSALDSWECLVASIMDFGESLNEPYKEALRARNDGYGDCPSCAVTLSEHLDNQWSFAIFSKVLDAINILGTSLFNEIAVPSIQLMAVLLGLWLAVQIGKHIMSFAPQDPMDFWTRIGRVCFKTIVAAAILVQPASIVSDLIVSPLVVGAAEFNIVIFKSYANVGAFKETFDDDGKAVEITELKEEQAKKEQLSATHQTLGDLASGIVIGRPAGLLLTKLSSDEEQAARELQARVNALETPSTEVFASRCSAWMKESPSKDGSGTAGGTGSSGDSSAPEGGYILNSQVRGALLCMVQTLHEEIALPLALGSAIICKAWHAVQLAVIRFPDFPMLFCGLILWLTCFLIMVMFIFKLLDATVRLGVLCALLPLLIIAWVFPPTVSFAKQGLKLLVHVLMTLIVMAIVLALAILFVIYAFQTNDANLIEAFLNNDVVSLKEGLDLSGSAFFVAILCCLFAIKMTGQVDKTAGEYSHINDGGTGFGTSAGDMAGTKLMSMMAHSAQAAATITIAGAGLLKANDRRNRNSSVIEEESSSESVPILSGGQREAVDRVLYGSNGKFNERNAELLIMTDDQFEVAKRAQRNQHEIARNQAIMGTVIPGRPLTVEQEAAENYLRAHKQEVALLKRYNDTSDSPLLTQEEKERRFKRLINDIDAVRNEVPNASDRREYVKSERAGARERGEL